jgi:hypothetical protein
MHSRQVEQLARQRTSELTRHPNGRISPPRSGAIRSQAGWAIVAIGLRIAESGKH